MQANSEYWAYVLVQYDSENFSYNYGFTFKDSAGYGMYPTVQSEINPKSTTQIKTGLELTKPTSGKATTIAEEDNWNGFKVNSDTNLVVLEAEREENKGDGETTCTLYQKGSNYKEVEEEKLTRPQLLTKLIKDHNTLITAKPTLTKSSNNTSDASGLYSSTATIDGKATYYFRGDVKNNYVKFAGLDWKIIRINEDGTIRLILNGGIENNTSYKFNTSQSSYTNMYYSNSNTAKPTVDSWYQTNIGNKEEYDSHVALGVFCEQAKVKFSLSFTSGSATMDGYSRYTPDFRCTTDGNGKGIIDDSKVGLITYDEVIHAGGYYNEDNSNYYLYYKKTYTTMSPAGFQTMFPPHAYVWFVNGSGDMDRYDVPNSSILRPVINLNTDVLATGTGEEGSPYVVITE